MHTNHSISCFDHKPKRISSKFQRGIFLYLYLNICIVFSLRTCLNICGFFSPVSFLLHYDESKLWVIDHNEPDSDCYMYAREPTSIQSHMFEEWVFIQFLEAKAVTKEVRGAMSCWTFKQNSTCIKLHSGSIESPNSRKGGDEEIP